MGGVSPSCIPIQNIGGSHTTVSSDEADGVLVGKLRRNLGVALSTERGRTSNERIVLPERKGSECPLVDNAGILVTRQFGGISGGVVEVFVLVKEPLNLGVERSMSSGSVSGIRNRTRSLSEVLGSTEVCEIVSKKHSAYL